MSSVQPQRELINERQVAPAEETFTEFKEIIVKAEEESDDERSLLDFTRTPKIILHRIDVLQPYVVKEEVLADKFLFNQDNTSSLNHEEPEPLRIKEEQEQLEHQQIKEEEDELAHQQIKAEEEEPSCQQMKGQEELAHQQIKEEQQELEHQQIKEEMDSQG
ncbi:hypothetical protein ATANTOWER_020451 [Ataeniobius toweri]|uniref:Uncharacterized protein n=2 Tax=Goodeidae TaxID=28758 RepID=A0ABU7BH42_9TELE|nr:hypothetical protein [Ataeniobius toweri]